MKKLIPLYLNTMSLDWILGRLEKATSTYFVADMIRKDILSALKKQEKVDKCKHVKGEFIGKKISCLKCDSFFEAGCYESWTKKL